MKEQTTEHIQQLAWECGFLLSVDLPKLIKFASFIRSDALEMMFPEADDAP